MTIVDFIDELKNWKFTRYKLVNLAIGVSALLFYELLGRPVYRPYIYSHKIYDYHLADTLGNSLGTIAAIFIFLAIFTSSKSIGKPFIKLISLTLVIYETGQPLLGKTTDVWDIFATILAGILSYYIYNFTFKEKAQTTKTG